MNPATELGFLLLEAQPLRWAVFVARSPAIVTTLYVWGKQMVGLAKGQKVTEVDPGVDRLLRLRDVLYLTGLTSSTLYGLAAKDAFPVPLKISDRSVAWRRSEVLKWIEERPRAELRVPEAAAE